MKKKWLITGLVTGLLAIVVTSGAVFAQAAPTPADGSKTFAARVAAILGIEQTKVEDAMKQARTEMQDEAVKAKLDALVAAGRLSQAQADEYLARYNDRPEGIRLPGIFGGHGHHRPHHRGFRPFGGMDRLPEIAPAPADRTRGWEVLRVGPSGTPSVLRTNGPAMTDGRRNAQRMPNRGLLLAE